MALALASVSAATSIQGNGGMTVSVDAGGSYEVFVPGPGWRFSGNAGAPLTNVNSSDGSDALGGYSEIAFDFQAGAPSHASIRAYANLHVVLFSATQLADGPNNSPFPVFSRCPREVGHLNFAGMFSFPTFYGFASDSPWVFFDAAANAFIVAPAANFMVAETKFGPREEIVSGIAPGIATLPAGFTHRVMLVTGAGINRTLEEWGRALTGLYGKTRPANDADLTLKSLGYWTDTGASYYYRTEPSMSYQQTLAAVKKDFDAKGLSLGYVQLDSWFYPKGKTNDWNDRSGGIYTYAGAEPIFGKSLTAFQQKFGLPLVTHARWIDPASPYRQQYRMSGNVAVDPNYWEDVAAYLAASGVVTYEQDWLFNYAQTDFNLADPPAFLDRMAAAMARHGISMQYCMATPRHLMQASAYPNLTTARVSGDRFDRNVWWNFLFASRLASALGIYPFTDVFMSSEADNLLMAVLSAGPVGIGDAVGRIDVAGLLRAVRPDGVIVKPDVPLAPLDSTYIREWKGLKAPVVASTYTDALDFRTHYVFAFSQGDDIVASFHTSELGVTGTAYVYDYLTGLGRLVGPSDLVSQPMPAGKAFFVVAPIGPSGVALIGDQGHFVTMGSRRVTSAFDDGAAHMTVAFTSGETVRTIRGYAPRLPLVTATEGAAAPVQYDTTSQQFTVDLWPGPGLTASVKIEISGFAHRGRPDPSGSDPDRTRRHSASPRRQSR